MLSVLCFFFVLLFFVLFCTFLWLWIVGGVRGVKACVMSSDFFWDDVSDVFWVFFSVSHVTCFSDLSHSSNLSTSANHKKPDSGAVKVSVRLVWGFESTISGIT